MPLPLDPAAREVFLQTLRTRARAKRGKTLEQIYGKVEADSLKERIAAPQLGRPKNWSEEGFEKVQKSWYKTGEPAPKPYGFGDTMRTVLRAKNGGIPSDPRQCSEMFECRAATLTRDNYTCQDCGIAEQEFKDGQRLRGSDYIMGLDVHHIKPFDEFPNLRYVVSNCLTLCRNCHGRRERQLEKEKGLPGNGTKR